MNMEAAVKTRKKSLKLDVRTIVKIALLGAISTVVMFFEIPLGFAPSFYKIDFSEVFALIGAFALGPVAGFMIELIKVLLHMLLKGTTTAGVGDFANLLIGCAFIIPASMLYRRKKSFSHAAVGLIIGTLSMSVIGGFVNAYVLLPVYAAAFQMPIQALIDMGSQINSNITGLGTLVLWAVVPFNLLKGFICSLVTIVLYKRISPVLHK